PPRSLSPPRRPPTPALFPYTTLFRSYQAGGSYAGITFTPDSRTVLASSIRDAVGIFEFDHEGIFKLAGRIAIPRPPRAERDGEQDRKSTRLNSSHVAISYAVFCLKKK